MRLIDVDEIRYTSLEDGFGRIKQCIAFSTDIDKMPTVEAIPIEWIEQWEIDHEWEYQTFFRLDTKPKYPMECMIEDWRKENENRDLLQNE